MNTGDTYLNERAFTAFDAMPSICRNLSPERRKLVVRYIDYMKQRVDRNYLVWTRETLKYLVKYVLLK